MSNYYENNKEKIKARSLERYYKHKEELLLKMRIYTEKNKEAVAIKKKEWQDKPENKKKHNEASVKWQEKNKAKKKAQEKVGSAIRSNKLTRPETCSICGQTDCKIQAHHWDYDKPLDVVWCCIQCHNDIHHNNLMESK